MQISPAIYENLTDTQRVTALLEAVKRKDHAEAKRLIESVGRKDYEMPDAVFTDTLISQMLADEKILDKAGAYKALQSIFGRKEGTKEKYIVNFIGVGGNSTTGPIYPPGYGPEDKRKN